MRPYRFIILALLIPLFASMSCGGTDSYSKSVVESCKASNLPECSNDCVAGKFHYCHVDPKYYKPARGWRSQCYGVHVGRSCRPCSNKYYLNFGGAMRQVNCKEFHKSLENKNKICDDCLEKVENI